MIAPKRRLTNHALHGREEWFKRIFRDQIAEAAGIEVRSATTGSRQPATAVVPENDPVVGEDTAVTDHNDA